MLTPEAKEALGRARDLALGEGYDRAQPHHILAALLEASTARQVLDLYGLDVAGLRITLEHFSRPAFPLDREAEERTLGLAREEARRLRQRVIGAEHLLLALVRQPDTLAAGVLGTFGVTRDPTREAIRYLHGLVLDWEPPSEAGPTAVHGGSFPLMFVGDATQPDDEADDELAGAFREFFGDDDVPTEGELESVIGIGRRSERSGVTVEAIALELRTTVTILHWAARPLPPRLLGDPDVVVSDDVATRYRALPSGGSGGEHGMRYETYVLPRPPAAASRLSIEIRSFGRQTPMLPSAGPWDSEEPVDGPWLIDVSLETGTPHGP